MSLALMACPTIVLHNPSHTNITFVTKIQSASARTGTIDVQGERLSISTDSQRSTSLTINVNYSVFYPVDLVSHTHW